MTFNPDKYQEPAIKTFNGGDDPVRHALLGLAGEAGELIELFKKHEYKPGFNWWDCKHCEQPKDTHYLMSYNACYPPNGKTYAPKVLDELGDFWYYLRIATWQQEVSIEEWANAVNAECVNELTHLSIMNLESARILKNYQCSNSSPDNMDLWSIFLHFMRLLALLDCSLDRLTELNYQKLNSEPTAHGWRK